MKKKSASKVVELLGGPFRAAATLGTSPQAVCNWVRRDTIPPGRAADIIRAALSSQKKNEEGKTVYLIMKPTPKPRGKRK